MPADPPTISWGDALRMQDELVDGFSRDDFQARLHERWAAAGDDVVAQAKARQEVCMEVQGPILVKFGFEASRKGLVRSVQAFSRSGISTHPEIWARNLLLEWLVHPGLQAEGPAPVGEHAVGKMALQCCRGPPIQPPPPDPPPEEAPEPPASSAPPQPLADAPAQPRAACQAAVRSKLDREKLVRMQAELIAACAGSPSQARPSAEPSGGSGGPKKRDAAPEDAVPVAQRPILRRYGFHPSRKGMSEFEELASVMGAADPEASVNRAVLAWLLEPPAGACQAVAERSADEYQIYVTEANDEAVPGIERCRGALACAHRDLYREAYPGVQQQEWLGALGREGIPAFLKEGGLVLHAELAATGEVVGYVSCRCNSGEEGGERRGAPHAAVNHIGVLPRHQGRGVGGVLFEGLQRLLLERQPGAADDLRVNVVELNARAVAWYRRLGFVVVQLWTRRFSVRASTVPVVFLTMQRRSDPPPTPWEQFFGHSLKGERLVVFPESAPPGLLAHAVAQPWPPMGIAPAAVAGFDPADGCHGLEDGRVVDLTAAYAHGRVIFERPLHKILSSTR